MLPTRTPPKRAVKKERVVVAEESVEQKEEEEEQEEQEEEEKEEKQKRKRRCPAKQPKKKAKAAENEDDSDDKEEEEAAAAAAAAKDIPTQVAAIVAMATTGLSSDEAKRKHKATLRVQRDYVNQFTRQVGVPVAFQCAHPRCSVPPKMLTTFAGARQV